MVNATTVIEELNEGILIFLKGNLVLSTITVVVTATPVIEELIEGILYFLGSIVSRVETNMPLFLFAKKSRLLLF